MPSFPTVTLLDSLERNESPLSNGAKWKAMHGSASGHTGESTTNGWKSVDSFGTSDMAYWVPEQFASPAVAATMGLQESNKERGWLLYACIAEPEAVGITAYVLRLNNEEKGVGDEWAFELLKRKEETFTLLGTKKEKIKVEEGDKVGLQAVEGKVFGWLKKGAGAWAVVAEATDASYTTGYVGIEGRGINDTLKKFEAGTSVEGNKTKKLEGALTFSGVLSTTGSSAKNATRMIIG